MSTKKHVKALWDYLCAEFEADEITAAFEATVEGFEYDVADINAAMIDAVTTLEAKHLLFHLTLCKSLSCLQNSVSKRALTVVNVSNY